MYSIQRILAAATLFAAMSPAAHAVELFTPAAASQTGSGSIIVCSIVNVGTSPIGVSATVQNFTDGSNITAGTDCPASPATLPPGAGCNAFAGFAPATIGYCHLSATSSKVRGALLVMNPSAEVTSSFAATK